MEQLSLKNEIVKKFGKFYRKGTILFREGERGDKMYVIHEGKVKVFRIIKGTERILAILQKGDFFGEMAILTKNPRSASIEVIEDSILLEITEEQLLEFIKEEPGIALKMLAQMAKRIENSNKLIENLLIKDEKTQSINALVQVAEEMEKMGRSGEWFRFEPDRFIAMAGVSTEVAKKVFTTLKRMGFIDVKGKNIKINSVPKLKEFINFLLWSQAISR